MLKLNGFTGVRNSKNSKRVGRGNGSGKGTFCGRGMNGQNCRSGGGVPSWFEWGQTPLFRRMPKLKGFSNSLFKKQYNVVNISDLAVLAENGITTINKEVLLEKGLLRKKNLGVKILGKGELNAKIEVAADRFTATAKAAIEKAGGKVELV